MPAKGHRPTPALTITQQGAGRVSQLSAGWHLDLPAVPAGAYHNAQITGYDPSRPVFTHAPPLRLTVRAQASAPHTALRGTAGFGFWNHPFAPGSRRLRLPQAMWFFFAGPDSDMALALGQPGHGWKAATFAPRLARFAALLPLALPGFALMRIPPLYRTLWPIGQHTLGVEEHTLPLDLLAENHEYELTWERGHITFGLDGQLLLTVRRRLRGPLGFIAWMDNQMAVVTPQGRFGHGLVGLPQPQSLTLDFLFSA